jgi:hypothetical protein
VSRKRRRNGQPVDDIRDRIRKASLEMKSDEKLCWREIKSGEKLDLVVIWRAAAAGSGERIFCPPRWLFCPALT